MSWDTSTARRARWSRRAGWRSDHVTALIIYLAGVATMIAAGIGLILLGPRG